MFVKPTFVWYYTIIMIANFRDLGGLPVGNNRVVKKGLFYRSATIDFATNEELDEYKKLGIKVGYDFREKGETHGDRAYEYIGAEHRNIPASYKNDKLFKLKGGGMLGMVFREVTWEDVAPTYEHLPLNNKAYKALMNSLIEGEVPLMMNCSAGKDRAGIGATIILLVLGADYDTILEEYMRSTEAQHFNEWVIGRIIPKFAHKYVFSHFHAFFMVYKELLDTSLNKIIEAYGDYETYFEKEFGITAEIRQMLIERYTEEVKVEE